MNGRSIRTGVRLLGVAAALAGALPLPDGRLGPITSSQIQPEMGHAFLASASALGVTTPSDADGGSSIVLLEDGRALAGGNQHDEIRNVGRGRFSHWGAHIYFSSTDNSDPRINGRTYTVRVPRSLLGSLIGSGRASPPRRRNILIAGMALFVLSFAAFPSLWLTAGQIAACAVVAALSRLSLPASLLGLVGLGLVFATPTSSTSSDRAGRLHRYVEALGLSLVVAGALGLVVIHAIALATTPVGWDEGIMLAQTEHLLQGQRLYSDVMTQYPPGIYMVLTPALSLWHDVMAARIIAGLVHLGIALLAALLARRITRDPAAPWLAAGLWLACATAFEADTLISDPFSTLPALGGLVCLAPRLGGLASLRRCFLAGLLLAAGALGKQMGFLWVLPAGLWLLAWPTEPFSARLQRLGALAAGCAVVGVPTLLILSGRPRALFCTIFFPLSDRYPNETTWALLRDTVTPDRWTILLTVLFLAALVSVPRLASPERLPGRSVQLLLWLVAIVSLYPFSKRAYAHYGLPTLAALAALAGGGAGRLRAFARAGRPRLAVALLMIAALLTLGRAARSVNMSHRASGLYTLEDDAVLVASLRKLAPVGAEVVCTWPFAMFANRYQSPLRFHYDLAFTVPGELWLEEWRDLGRLGRAVELLVVRSRRNVYDMAGPLWKQLAPEESLTPTAQEPVLRPLVLPPVLWFAREGDRNLRLLVEGAPQGAAIAVRGTTDAPEVFFESDWSLPTHAAVQPRTPFRGLFPSPRDSWHLARAFVAKGQVVSWQGADPALPVDRSAGYDSGAQGTSK